MKKTIFTLTVMVAVLFGGDFEDGLNAYNNKDYKKAEELWIKAANKGNVSAQYNLGNMYVFGLGVKKNFKKAVEYYQKAAIQGDVNSQVNLGNMYNFGKGVKKNSKKSYKLLSRSCKSRRCYGSI